MRILRYYKIYHQLSKNHYRGLPLVPLDREEWPEEWKTIYYKSYPRLPKIDFIRTNPSAGLFEAIRKRTSRRDFSSSAVSLKELSTLLEYSAGYMERDEKKGKFRRAYPSAGKRYPIEIYPLVLRVSGLKTGLYHYDVKNHALDYLWDHDFDEEELKSFWAFDWVGKASIILFMTAVFGRAEAKYGERAYRYTLLEAGHIGQNISLVAEALKLKCCALGGTWDDKVDELLDIDGTTESIVYALIIGR